MILFQLVSFGFLVYYWHLRQLRASPGKRKKKKVSHVVDTLSYKSRTLEYSQTFLNCMWRLKTYLQRLFEAINTVLQTQELWPGK